MKKQFNQSGITFTILVNLENSTRPRSEGNIFGNNGPFPNKQPEATHIIECESHGALVSTIASGHAYAETRTAKTSELEHTIEDMEKAARKWASEKSGVREKLEGEELLEGLGFTR